MGLLTNGEFNFPYLLLPQQTMPVSSIAQLLSLPAKTLLGFINVGTSSCPKSLLPQQVTPESLKEQEWFLPTDIILGVCI